MFKKYLPSVMVGGVLGMQSNLQSRLQSPQLKRTIFTIIFHHIEYLLAIFAAKIISLAMVRLKSFSSQV